MTNRSFFIIFAIFISISTAARAASASDDSSHINFSLQQLSSLSSDIAEQALRSVVKIEVIGVSTNSPKSNSERLVSRFRASGSGFVVDPAGYIITNAHVIKDAQLIRIIFPAHSDASRSSSILKSRVKPVIAELIGMDEETDMAVLKIDQMNMEYIPMADSNDVKSGHLVWAIGSPFGLNNTVTMGIVSTTARQLKPDDPMIYIQTDAAVNPGSSGGPLINSLGEVVGVNASIFTKSGGSDGISLAIPSNIMRYVFEKIKQYGYVPRGDIGVNAQTITPEIQQGLGLTQNWGVILSDVLPGSSALEAGLIPGDVIVSIDGKVMENARQFIVNIYAKKIDSLVSLQIIRNAQPSTVDVKIVERRNSPTVFGEFEKEEISSFGIFVSNIDGVNKPAEKYKRGKGGVLVEAKMKYTNQSYPEIKTKDIIYSINGAYFADVEGFRKAVSRLKPGAPVVLHIERRGKLRFVTFYWN